MVHLAAIMVLSQQPIAPVAEGVASYYTVASSSQLTASGEPMQDDALTCAMLAGEFGKYYRVEADNGESVIVRLNDRGPYVNGRVIDLSEAAIRRLHPRHGLLNVRVYEVKPPAEPAKS